MPADDDFVPIGSDVYIRRGRKNATISRETEMKTPTIVLIFGWMGAQLPHLHKYTKIYEELYPEATQVLIRCTPSVFWVTRKARHSRVAPVVEVLEALGCVTPRKSRLTTDDLQEPPRVLIHTFSNGGSYMLTTLSQVLAELDLEKSPTMPCALIIDSSPGRGNLASSKRAFQESVKNPLARFVVGLFITILHYYAEITFNLFGVKPPIEVVVEALSNPQILPWVNVRTPRLYIYSKTDRLIAWKEIQAHTEGLKQSGFNVKTELFEQSPHVAHARADPPRYWAAVGSAWGEARALH